MTFQMKRITPILRIFDEEKTRQFYFDFLAFKCDWEHRYESDMPLYMQISNGDCILHLSEHYGDCTPGSAIRIEVEDAKALQQHLLSKTYTYARPGFDVEGNQVSITDPFGNRLHFYSAK
ncbi:bleomycin resistance family protein [Paenibacillus sp. FSL H8-0548]|uniref:glyoxalase superfamily protein n=1 Tax=Paenibacillus sp. FSL H8-0548 TaxID=1920422 RepID=UPI00096FE9D0|nr:glyoxalase superfamily protein [Paenibacillus sp. FSL H8-0548]OMF21466.1 bleomycin resistance family protein [Paenibacillus sp. FSL H8-0548]